VYHLIRNVYIFYDIPQCSQVCYCTQSIFLFYKFESKLPAREEVWETPFLLELCMVFRGCSVLSSVRFQGASRNYITLCNVMSGSSCHSHILLGFCIVVLDSCHLNFSILFCLHLSEGLMSWVFMYLFIINFTKD